MANWDDPADRDGQSWQSAPESEAHYLERVAFFGSLAVDSSFPSVRKFATDQLAKYQERLQQLRQQFCETKLPF